MDLFQTARYFDRQEFENYDFSAPGWRGDTFMGQLKLADKFQTIYHRPTRKRMLYCPPEVAPSPVIRVGTTGEIFMVGSLQQDSHANVHYRNVYALHRPAGIGVITRRAPAGPANNPGWAVETEVGPTWWDLELRSTNENEESTPFHRSFYFGTFPSNSAIQRFDLVTFEGLPYFILDVYTDSSMRAARCAQHIDPRRDIVYRSRQLPDTYSGGQAVRNYIDYNVTARVGPAESEDSFSDVAAKSLMVRIQEGWIGVTPKLDDAVTVDGVTYVVKRVLRDPTMQEWNLEVSY